ncbi:exodeoxyribonuclease V subunit gamma [Colwellia sp. KU-HH00111]
MENLLLLLNKISQLSPLGVFNQEVVVVQNAGMQHWLNLAIAKERGISMNMRYALPAQYLWQLIRTLASDEKVPEQSPYSREVLTWRIYALLATQTVINDNDFTPATRYWLTPSPAEQHLNSHSSSDNYSGQNNLKRYQLAGQMADLYEQYLIFRPHWLDSWQKGEAISQLANDDKWQAKLWQLLIQQQAYNPVELLQDAMSNIDTKLAQDPLLLPKRLSFFGINSMAPMWLTFLNAISEHIEVDFFHLNPCFSYWGDIISEKQAMKKLAHWSDGVSDEHLFVGNPLLANFGQQGREFLALLQEYSTVDVELFVKAAGDNTREQENTCILHRLQNDILSLEDATKTPSKIVDNSITIVSCHSALREVQALHDYLLHQFNDSAINAINPNDKLTPKDVLVMCPQIEQYAPYVNAVFTRGWQDLNDEVPPLPCSIADRSAKDSDPLIAGFTELLSLPDSRFQVSQLLSFIRLPAVANKFAINAEDSEKISLWLAQATVHWGLDQTHKQEILGANATSNFTWQQGLSRLLRGFAYADVDSIYQDQLVLATVEGDDAVLLGQLLLFIEQLQQFTKQLSTPRTANQWQGFLLNQLELLFATDSVFSDGASKGNNQQLNSQIENSLAIIEQAIAGLVEYCQHAHFEEKIDLAIVVDFLNNHFSQGDSSRQFMIGQVTFCSMLPMRSIPFKIIAVLGLNDGEFPRQRQPLGFDLMAQSPAQLGDRSRRGDDRYLFLEAMISARHALYLSFQGRNIKNNNEKQPSLVLKELMDYLSQGYGWCFTSNNMVNGVVQENHLQQLPMQPFSLANYHTNEALLGTKPSFDANWLTLAQHKQISASNSPLVVNDEKSSSDPLAIADLIRFFHHPSKMFAQGTLNLYLDDRAVYLDDVEPFSADHLETYLLKQDLLAAHLFCANQQTQSNEQALDPIEQVLERAKLSGKFPDLPSTTTQFETWLEDTELFSGAIISQGCENPEFVDCHITLTPELTSTLASELTSPQVSSVPRVITAKLPLKFTHDGAKLVFYRSSTAKAKDRFTLYLHQLFVQVWQLQNMETDNYQSHPLSQVQGTCGFYFNTKAQQVEQLSVTDIEGAQAQLKQLFHCYLQGQQQALLLNGDLAGLVFKKSRGKSVEMTQARFEEFWSGAAMQGKDAIKGFGEDPYIQYFWPQCPDISDCLSQLTALYQGLYDSITSIKGDSA